MFKVNTPLGIVKVMMMQCSSIVSVEKTGETGLTDTYTIHFTNGNETTFEVENGNGIVSVEKTAESGLTDTYTITFTNGDTTTFNVTNGNGSPSDAEDVAYILGVDSE